MATKFSTRIYSERTPHQGTSAAQMRNAPRFSIPRYAAYSGKPGRVEIVFEIELPARDPIPNRMGDTYRTNFAQSPRLPSHDLPSRSSKLVCPASGVVYVQVMFR